MHRLEEINVHIGEVKLANEEQMLKTILGSCIGIALRCRKREICTLSHSLLPKCPDARNDISGRWVDLAVSSALQLLEAGRREIRHLEAIVAGGGNMIENGSSRKVQIGEMNIQMATTVLESHRIPIVAEETGGIAGRQLLISGYSMEYQISEIPKLIEPSNRK